MKVNIVEGPQTDKNIQKVYDYLVKEYKKEMLARKNGTLQPSDHSSKDK